MPTLLSSLSLMPSCALQRTLTVLCLLNSQSTMMNCFSLSRSLWFTPPVAIKTPVLLAWSMAAALRVFPRPLEQRPLSLKTLMLTPGVVTQARFLKSRAVKYIYKYVYRGHDRTTMEFGRCKDEIKQYLDARYISSCEALWRLYLFGMQKQVPNVVRLQVHLYKEQGVTFREDEDGQDVIAECSDRATTLTGWFEANATLPENDPSRLLLYQNYPSQNVWNAKAHKWTPRAQSSFAIGRMYHAYPTSKERFYLCLLLTTVPGATSFENLRTFEGTLHLTFKDACIARGLLEDDSEWRQCLREARHMATGYQLRHLFVTILRDCTPTDPRACHR